MVVVNSGGAAAAGSYYMRQQAAARAAREAELRRKNGIALLNAAKENNTAKVQSLLKKDTPLSFCDKESYTALHYAVSYENEAIVVKLIANGANPMAASQNGPTPIEVAAEVGSGKLLNYLINQAYGDKLSYRRHETDRSIVEKAHTLGHSTIIALTDYILLHYPDSLNDKKIQIDLAELINAFYSIAAASPNKYQDHCYRMGVFLQKRDALKPYRAYAIAFLALANDYKKAKKYKANTYLKVMKRPDIEYTASSLKEWLHEQELGKKSENKLIQVAIALKKLPANALINNEIGEIYELLGKNEKAFQFFKQAAWNGNRESVIHLSHLAPLMSKRQDELAKYTAMCYHWGIGGKGQNNSKAAKYLNQSVLDDFDQTLTYVKKHGKKLALDILKKSSLMAKLDVDFLLSLFNDADIRSKLTHKEIANFLIYCAKNYPTHDWVRDYSYFLSTIKALKKDTLSEELIHVYFIVALLNDDNPPSKVKKYIKHLTTIEQETLEKLLEKLSPHYEKDKINQVLHVIQAYQQLRNQKHPSTEDISADLNSDELHQLFNLVENSKYIRKKHTLERVIQKAAFVELHSEENHEARKEKMEQALNDPLFKNRHTFFFNPARLLPVKELTELKKELKTMDTGKISDHDENEENNTIKLSQ